MIELPERSAPYRTRALTRRRRDRTGGAEGNARLTASTAVVLLVLLAAEGATLLSLRSLVSVHIFIGMLLLPPVALKLASTGWRFLRYYGGARAYRLAGAPIMLLRALGPVVVLSTLALFASGVALAVAGPQRGIVLGLHKASFVIWFGSMAVHVLGHLFHLPRLAGPDWSARPRLGGARMRRVLLVGSLVAGVVLAAATLPLAGPWTSFVR